MIEIGWVHFVNVFLKKRAQRDPAKKLQDLDSITKDGSVGPLSDIASKSGFLDSLSINRELKML